MPWKHIDIFLYKNSYGTTTIPPIAPLHRATLTFVLYKNCCAILICFYLIKLITMLLTHLVLHFSLAYSACTAAARRRPGAARKQALSGVSMANGGVPSSSGSEGGNNGTSNVSSGPSSAKSGPVALWEPCNFPSQGINGPLPCADGAQCICKDECRRPFSIVRYSKAFHFLRIVKKLADNAISICSMPNPT